MDLWDNLEKAIDVVSKGNDAYIDIKQGNKTTDTSQLAEQSAQGNKGSMVANILSVNSLFIIGSIASIIALVYVFKGK